MVVSMVEPTNPHWRPLFKTFYQAYYQELASEALFLRWQKIDICTGILVACTATGSAVAGWALWTHPTGATLWAFIAGFAAFGSIVHAAMTVPTRLKEQVTLRGLFSALRVQLETCLNQIIIDVTKDASADYDRLRAKYAEYVGRAAPDIAFTTRLRVRVQNSLDKKIEEYIQ